MSYIGVDVVLNSLSGDKLFASVRCLAKHGRFLEIGKHDLISDSKLGETFVVEWLVGSKPQDAHRLNLTLPPRIVSLPQQHLIPRCAPRLNVR